LFHDYLVDAGALSATASGAASVPQMIRTYRTGCGGNGHKSADESFGALQDLGEHVVPGDVVARILDPMEMDPSRAWTPVVASTNGVVFARWHQRVVRAGMAVCKIAGKDVIRTSGNVHLLD